jgi:hypothetical protein
MARGISAFDVRRHSPINVTSVTNGDNCDHKPCIVNLIDHTVSSDTDSPRRASRKFGATDWAWIRGKSPNRGNDAGLGTTINSRKLLLGNAQNIDRIVHA